jgi:hypothetical protein
VLQPTAILTAIQWEEGCGSAVRSELRQSRQLPSPPAKDEAEKGETRDHHDPGRWLRRGWTEIAVAIVRGQEGDIADPGNGWNDEASRSRPSGSSPSNRG